MELKKKKIFFSVGIIILLIGIIGLARAFLTINGKQELANTFTSGCLNIRIESESSSIDLTNQIPITDIEGLNTNGYNFTIHNTCDKESNYAINLESLNETDNSLKADFVRVSLSSDTMDNLITNLNENTKTNPTIDHAYEAYTLYTGSLSGDETKTFTLKEWLDYDTTKEEGASKRYESRINVIAGNNFSIETFPEIKYEKNGLTLTGTITGNASKATYCTTIDNECEPEEETQIEANKVTITIADKDEEQMVCTKLDEGKIICSNPGAGYCPPGAKACKTILANKTIEEGQTEFTGIETNDNTGKLFTGEDDFGTTYYYRGAVNDNWVKFGKEGNDDLWWRIIRVNGNGTIRLIYSGKGSTPSITGTGTQITTTYSDKINQKYNADNGDNTYVGFMYGTAGQTKYADTHKNNAKSTIMDEIEKWYVKTTLGSLNAKIDVDTGFCNDRQTSVASHGDFGTNGWGTQQTAYAPWDRLLEADTINAAKEQKPTLKCGKDATSQKKDLFTGPSATQGGTDGIDGKVEGNGELSVPVGLITSDEVVFAGGFMYQNNNGYWLYTNQAYWTMSPYNFRSSYAYVFGVNLYGGLVDYSVSWTGAGVRPVINLKADLDLIGDGTTENPYRIDERDKLQEAGKSILANNEVKGFVSSVTGPSCDGEKGTECYTSGTYKNNMAQNGLYEAEDDFGASYVFRGAVNNNWVKFGQEGSDDLWWRIIRINGNGTIRLIYAGKGSSPSTTGTGTQITTTYSDVYSTGVNQKYNADYNDNTYVGLMYGSTGQSNYGATHVNTSKSTIMTELETWYTKTTLGALISKIDVNTGFCNDRGLADENHGSYLGPNGGYKQVQTAYAPWDRLLETDTTSAAKKQEPTLKCGKDATAQKRDLFTGPEATGGGTEGKNGKVEGNGKLSVPVGLITSDEVVFAGGFMYQNNNGYWLYTNQNYWSMSPSYFYNSGSSQYASVFIVYSYGNLSNTNVSGANIGVRPVINLKANTNFTFESEDAKGTISNPYIVS